MAIEEKYTFFQEVIDQFENEFYPDISEAVISFSNFRDKNECKYIYHGYEKMPFNERHPTYQKIFIHEFLHG